MSVGRVFSRYHSKTERKQKEETLVKEFFKLYITKAVDWYWQLERKTRHTVGWSIVAVGLVAILGIGYGLVYGIYSGWVAASEWVASLFDEEPVAAPLEDADVLCLNYYSGDYRHREFPCGELNRRRSVNLSRDFNDVNDTQLVAARRLGIQPQPNRESLDALKGKLVHLEETRFYKLDPMTQSVPYLVPDAADFLTALGERWQEYHGTNSRFIITSCTRTDADVKRLKQVNVNATKDSAHRYGTTFDITWSRYDRRGKTHDGKLKADLARALYDLRAAGYCYVKYEYKQACFHVTVRPL